MPKTKIEWVNHPDYKPMVWNPVTGCTKVSAGCKNCYAETMTKRFVKAFPHGFDVTLHPERLNEPYKWKKPCMVFVNSMSDIFHEKVPDKFICDIFNIIHDNPQHIFQILTKRPKLASDFIFNWYSSYHLKLPDNVCLGVSIENQAEANKRIPILLNIPAKIRFLSCEPLLGNIDLKQYLFTDITGNYPFPHLKEKDRTTWLDNIQWVICGAESGAKKRPMQVEWALDLRQQCKEAGVPFFMKQMFNDKGKKLKFEEFPIELQIREYPIKQLEAK
jgi:protein gp37